MKDKERLEFRLEIIREIKKRLAAEFQLADFQEKGLLEAHNLLLKAEKDTTEKEKIISLDKTGD